MTSLKQAISSIPSQIITLNSRHIAFITLLNTLQELKAIRQAIQFLKKSFAHVKFIFTFFFFDGSARSHHIISKFLLVMVLPMY